MMINKKLTENKVKVSMRIGEETIDYIRTFGDQDDSFTDCFEKMIIFVIHKEEEIKNSIEQNKHQEKIVNERIEKLNEEMQMLQSKVNNARDYLKRLF